MIDIREHAEVLATINEIINKGGIVEVKLEKAQTEIAVVEIKRKLIKK